jgi:hypothetical protein
MVWRKTSPLARQLLQISEVVSFSADALRDPKRRTGGGLSSTSRAKQESKARL